jgi:hypothetical protein
MRIEFLIAPEDVKLVNNFVKNKDYEFIRSCAQHLFALNEKDFAIEFDYFLAKSYTIPIPDNNFDNAKLTEQIFIGYLNYKILKGIEILENYGEHLIETNRKPSITFEDTIDELYFKRDFIHLKIRKTVDTTDIQEIEKSVKKISTSKNKRASDILFEGKKLNISDKYHIACKIFGIDKKMEFMGHLSATEKHILLSNIMNCNQQTARELFNGTQQKRTPIQHNIVDDYLKTLTNK